MAMLLGSVMGAAVQAAPPIPLFHAAPLGPNAVRRSGQPSLAQMTALLQASRRLPSLDMARKKEILRALSGQPATIPADLTVYAALSPSHLTEPGKAYLDLISPLSVAHNGNEVFALFDSAANSSGVFASNLTIHVTAGTKQNFLIDCVVTPSVHLIGLQPTDPLSFTVFNNTDQTSQTQTLQPSGAQHLVFAFQAMSAGEYEMGVNSSQTAWILTSCEITAQPGS